MAHGGEEDFADVLEAHVEAAIEQGPDLRRQDQRLGAPRRAAGTQKVTTTVKYTVPGDNTVLTKTSVSGELKIP